MKRAEPVAVTGMGLICAAGATLPETLGVLERGEAVPLAAPPFPTGFPSPVFRCASVPEGDAAPARIFRSAALALAAAEECLACAGLSPEELWGQPDFGLAVGASVGPSLNFFDFYKARFDGETPPLDEIRAWLTANPAEALGARFQCAGPALCVTNACSSGADAIGLAADWVRSGFCAMALAGGADALSYITYAGFSSLRLPSPARCRPFDARRDGLSLGEGAGFILLESEVSRARRGRPALGFVAGYGTATDAWHLTAPHPDCRGLALAVDQAFAQAGASWKDIAFINAHGTGTPTNDAAEGAFFARVCPDVPFIATKGATGHTLGAAGAVEAVLSLAHLREGRLPASPGFDLPDPAIGAAPVSNPTPVRGVFALSQSLAFGGNNSVLLLAGGDPC
jgi:3-oxoacyl-[acyl-carrier-protein] synthase-1/3-oxoacyl-[acyl-carrier-protein] synthase II